MFFLSTIILYQGILYIVTAHVSFFSFFCPVFYTPCLLLQENQYTLDFLGAIDGAKDKGKDVADTAIVTGESAGAKGKQGAGGAGVVRASEPATKRMRVP